MTHSTTNYDQQLQLFNDFALHSTIALDIVKEYLAYGFDINSQYEKGSSFLSIAVKQNLPNIVEFLLKNGANPNILTEEGHTPLHLAVHNNYFDHNNYFEIVKLLINYGSQINSKNIQGNTALHFSTYTSSDKVFNFLIENGANPNIQNNSGDTSFHYLCRYNKVDLINHLFDKHIKVDIDITNSLKNTGVHIAAERNNFNLIKVLIEKGINVNAQNNDGETALHTAMNYNHVDTIKCLINSNIDINIKDNEGHTPLHLSLSNFMTDIAILLLKNPSIILNIITPSDNGLVPLHFAVQHGFLDVVQDMLKFDIDISKPNPFSETPLDLAIKKNHFEIAKLLESYQSYKDLSDFLPISNHVSKKPKL